jgi:catechol 2,3-dioxygenase
MSVVAHNTGSEAQPRTRFFRPRRLGHVNLYVSNIDRSMDYYIDFAGFQESYRQPLSKGGFVGNGNTHHDIGLIDYTGPLARGRKTPGLNHLAFELETEVDLVDGYQHAIADGVQFVFTMDHDIAHSVYGLDPDGNRYEIYADVEPEWRVIRSGIVTKPKPKWAPGMTPPNANRNYVAKPELLRVEDAVFHPRRTVHATLVLEHYREAFDYYTKIVGLEPLLGNAESPFAILGGTCGERNLSLFRATANRAPCLHHVGIEALDDASLDASVRDMRARGLEPVAEVDHFTRRSVFVRDPDGILLQFFIDRGTPLSAWSDVPEDLALYVA